MSRSVSFHVVAHADDWQLFMTPTATRELEAAAAGDHRVVFVHLTAGDDGFDRQFWLGREIGAVNSILYGLALLPDLEPTVVWSSFADRSVARYDVGPATAYFLRLPDGNMAGEGYDVTGRQSLLALLDERRTMTTLGDREQGDRISTYDDLGDVTATLGAILDHEIGPADAAAVHHLDPTRPDPLPQGHAEHADHMAVGAIVEAALEGDGRFEARTYLDYDSRLHPPNVTGDDLRLKVGMFLAYNFFARVVSGDRYPVTAVMDEYQDWLEREIRTNEGV